ncbi:16107_t:CDS:2 [Funneliformis caledonium]|uniref:16107_t:CDS:1 n=1 Tax=Funneliformis caledonium TaxID=1117310 RepID=A0A9N9H181_9GLOM|nr:16107_t:CDS:2 [Funneliformis caledonium]
MGESISIITLAPMILTKFIMLKINEGGERSKHIENNVNSIPYERVGCILPIITLVLKNYKN